MKSIPVSPGKWVGVNLGFLMLTLMLSLCLYASIRAGGLLLAYGHGERLVQGKPEQIIPSPDGVGEVHQIGFHDEQGNQRYCYQYHRHRSVRALGDPLYVCMTSEGIVLKSQISTYGFLVSIASACSLGLSLMVGGMLIKGWTHRIECTARSGNMQRMLHLFRCVMFVLSIAGVIAAANRLHTDFFSAEGKARVISVTCHSSSRYQVKAFVPSTGTEWEADWYSFHEVSPATGQEVNICYSSKAKPAFARTPSGKIYSVVLLCLALAYMLFTSLILIRGRILCR